MYSLNYQLKMLVIFLCNKIQQKSGYLPHKVYNQINKLE